MKMNLAIIADELESVFSYSRRVDGGVKLNLHYPLLYSKGTRFQENCLYIAACQDLPTRPRLPDSMAVICIGRAPKAFAEGTCAYLEFVPETDMTYLFNEVLRIFDDYDSWCARINRALIEGKPLETILSLFVEKLRNPLTLSDERNNIVRAPYGSGESPYTNDPAAQMDEFANLFSDPAFEDSYSTRGPQLWVDLNSSYDTIYQNIFLDGRYCGRILLDDTAHPFRASDYVLVNFLHDCLRGIVKREGLLVRMANSPINEMILQLLRGQPLDTAIQDVEIGSIWRGYTHFICVVAVLSKHDLLLGSGHITASRIEYEIPDSRAVVYEEQLVAIIPMREKTKHSTFVSEKLGPLLRDSLYKVGISTSFESIKNLRSYSIQARMAYEVGIQADPTQWIFYAQDYLLPYMLRSSLGSLSLPSICHPRLARLIKYDIDHDIDFTRTLECYLENECAQTKTAQELFLNRGTLLQRIERIRKISGFDLDDQETRMYLRMVFAIVRSTNAHYAELLEA